MSKNKDFVLLTYTLQIYLYVILFSSHMCGFGSRFMSYTPMNGALSLDLMVFK